MMDTMALLVIDPNSLRADNPGPFFYRLDSLKFMPGLTNRNGVFSGTINDNKNETREYDMTYLTPNSQYIRDNDEFWVGLQQDSRVVPSDPTGLENTWTPEAGGRAWVMGGFICIRKYQYADDGRITAEITGVDYTELWRSQPFGTPTTPRNYTVDTDLVTIVTHLLSDVNSLQLAGYQFTAHPTLFPTTPSGITWKKEFKAEQGFNVMVAACEELGYDWGIIVDPTGSTPAERRRVVMFPRHALTTPDSGMRIAYELNIREVPKIQVGSTSDLVTDIIINQSNEATVPPDVGQWMVPGAWPDKGVSSRRYSIASFPSPSNAANVGYSVANEEPDPLQTTDGVPVGYDKWSDYTQIIDDDGYPALNFRRAAVVGQNPTATALNRTFRCFLSFYTDWSGRPVSTQMHLDLRDWRRILFKFRHATRSVKQQVASVTDENAVQCNLPSVYKIRIHTNITTDYAPGDWDRRAFVYTFGIGNQQSNGVGVDVVNTSYWAEINILLPEVDESGAVTNWNGWAPEYTEDELSPVETADPTSIDFVSLDLYCGELDLDYVLGGVNWLSPSNATLFPDFIPLTVDVPAGSYWIRIENPEQFFYRGEARTILAGEETEILFYDPKPMVFIGDRNLGFGEWVQVDAINGKYPGTYNVLLSQPTQLDHYASLPGSPRVTIDYLWFPAEHSVSISQFRFQKNRAIDVSARAILPLQYLYPYRYRITSYTDVQTPQDAIAKAKQEFSELGASTQLVRVKVDGDPRLLMGWLVQPQLDPIREAIFHNIAMVIDDATYVVDGIDFYIDLTLGTIETRGRGYTPARQQASALSKFRTLESGRKTSMFGTVVVL